MELSRFLDNKEAKNIRGRKINKSREILRVGMSLSMVGVFVLPRTHHATRRYGYLVHTWVLKKRYLVQIFGCTDHTILGFFT